MKQLRIRSNVTDQRRRDDCGKPFGPLPCVSLAAQKNFLRAILGDRKTKPCGGRSEPAPLWWTSRKGLLSSEFRQCSRENFVQNHSRKTPSVA